MSWVSSEKTEPLAEPRNSFQETMRALADAAMSVTQHDSNEAEPGYINAVREMERKFARILKGKMKPMKRTPHQHGASSREKHGG